MITPILQAEIEKNLNRQIAMVAPLSAANNAHIYRLTLKGGGVCVAKVAEQGMDVEAFMLGYLKNRTKLPVPAVYYSNDHVIIMEFVESHHAMDDAAQVNAAELLAELHAIHSARYGFERDGLIAMLPQPNTESDDWVYFFTERRLLPMANGALSDGKIDKKIMKQVEKLAGKLGSYIKNPAPPSLIHGDIWSGNVLSVRGRVSAFLDPAPYYADPEIELAFIRAFNTFGDPFFRRYRELHPLTDGFDERADIYSLYPLLIHARIFGLSYVRKAAKILDRYA